MIDNDIEQPELDPDAGPVWLQAMVKAGLGEEKPEIETIFGAAPSGLVVAWAMGKANYKPPENYHLPEAWCGYGFDIKTPEFGCIVCLPGYVGLFHHQIGSTVYLLGEAQDGIGLRAVNESDIAACRWPHAEDFAAKDYAPGERTDGTNL